MRPEVQQNELRRLKAEADEARFVEARLTAEIERVNNENVKLKARIRLLECPIVDEPIITEWT